MRVEEWNEAYAREVETWRDEPPWDFYDLASDPADAAEMRDPTCFESYRAVLGDDGRLAASWYFDREGEIVEVGVGLTA